jgi:hypothetical protein
VSGGIGRVGKKNKIFGQVALADRYWLTCVDSEATLAKESDFMLLHETFRWCQLRQQFATGLSPSFANHKLMNILMRAVVHVLVILTGALT